MIRAGEIIVEEGQLITNEIYEELEIAGLLNEERNFFPMIGLLILNVLIGLFLFFELQKHVKNKDFHLRKLIAITILSLLTVILMKVVLYNNGKSIIFNHACSNSIYVTEKTC